MKKSQSSEILEQEVFLKTGFFSKYNKLWMELDTLTEVLNFYLKKPSTTSLSNRIICFYNIENADISVTSNIIRIKTKQKKTLKIKIMNDKETPFWFSKLREVAIRTIPDHLQEIQKENNEEVAACLKCIDLAPEEETQVEIPEESKLSFEEIPVVDENGKEVRIGDLIGVSPVVLLLLRQFGCMLCKHNAKIMINANDRLERIGVKLICIGTGTPKGAINFKKEMNFKGEIYLDQPRNLYKALCCKSGASYSMTKKTIAAAKIAFKEGSRQGIPDGNLFQLGGCIVATKQGVLFQHIERYAGHFVDPEAVVKTCDDWFLNISIDDILQDREFRTTFEKYLQEKEHSSENLTFFYEAEVFEKIENQMERDVAFRRIFQKYLAQDAEESINIPHNLSTTLRTITSDVPKDILINAKVHVYENLANDTLFRFRKSKYFYETRLSKIQQNNTNIRKLFRNSLQI